MKTKNCTGCLACYNICPANSITLITNSEGFIYPKKNLTSCVNCGLCEKTCPIITPHSINKTLTPTAFAGINKNEKIRTESSSGGIFTQLPKKSLITAVLFSVQNLTLIFLLYILTLIISPDFPIFEAQNMSKVKSGTHLENAKNFWIPGGKSFFQVHLAKSAG